MAERKKMTEEEIHRRMRLSREMLEGDLLWGDEMEKLFTRSSETLLETANSEESEE